MAEYPFPPEVVKACGRALMAANREAWIRTGHPLAGRPSAEVVLAKLAEYGAEMEGFKCTKCSARFDTTNQLSGHYGLHADKEKAEARVKELEDAREKVLMTAAHFEYHGVRDKEREGQLAAYRAFRAAYKEWRSKGGLVGYHDRMMDALRKVDEVDPT